jgi:hypothetical protein
MKKNKKTSVEITEPAKEAMERIQVRDSLKNMVSSGILLFELLNEEDKKAAILAANGKEPIPIDFYKHSNMIEHIKFLAEDNLRESRTTGDSTRTIFCEKLLAIINEDQSPRGEADAVEADLEDKERTDGHEPEAFA